MARLPPNIAPRGLSREEAAAYVGLSPSAFADQVAARALPQAIKWGRRAVWDRRALDVALDRLSGLTEGSDEQAAIGEAIHARKRALHQRQG